MTDCHCHEIARENLCVRADLSRRGDNRTLPAVRTVFLMDCIIRLSPEACSRTLVRSSGLDHSGVRPRCLVAGNGRRRAHCVIDAAIVAATPSEGERGKIVSRHSRDRN